MSALFPKNVLQFSTFYTIGILAGVVIFALCFRFNVLSAFHILFYRGLSLLIVTMLAQIVVLGLVLGWARRRNPGFPLSSGFVLPMALSSLALNLTFFVLIPVNLDHSISVFLLAWMEDHRETPQTRADLQQAFERIYVEADGAINRRIAEQLASGNIAPGVNGYTLTGRGTHFVAIAREIGLLFSTDPRFLHPFTPGQKDPSGNSTLVANTEPAVELEASGVSLERPQPPDLIPVKSR